MLTSCKYVRFERHCRHVLYVKYTVVSTWICNDKRRHNMAEHFQKDIVKKNKSMSIYNSPNAQEMFS
jgi:hypothetical protein